MIFGINIVNAYNCYVWYTLLYSSSNLRSTAATATAKSLQSCPTLCDLIDGSPPGSPLPGILQASKYLVLINSSWFIYFWLCWIFIAALGLSLVVVGGLLSTVVHGLIAVASLAVEYGF